MMVRLTVMTSSRPATLSKHARLGPDGTLVRGGGGVLVEGTAEITTVSSLADFADVLQRLGPAQALSYGLPRRGNGRILSRAMMTKESGPYGAQTRTRHDFAWPEGSGVLMLDHDADTEALSRDQLLGLIRDAAPGLADAAMLWWPSASSHICNAQTREDLTGLRGQRVYMLVREAADIPRAGAALIDRLWAAGHGRIAISAAGTALERCPVDGSVWQPERLDFAAGAACGPGLVQRRGAPVLIPGGGIVDTRSALPDDPAVKKAAASARRRAKTDAADAVNAAREAYLDRRADTLLHERDRDDPEKREAARAVFRKAVEADILGARFPIEVETAPGVFETVSVGRILNDRAGYHGRLTRDPLEPGYGGGRPVGKLFLLDARPRLYSFAHGGKSYRLVRSPERIEAPTGRLATATEATLDLLRKDPTIFEFGGQIVLVEDGRMHLLDEHALGYHLAGGIQFWQHRKVGGEFVAFDIDPPARLVRQLLSLGPQRRLKPLVAIITAPTVRPDGSVLSAPGYDAATDLLLFVEEKETTPVPSAPTRSDVEAALADLMFPFEKFPLVDAFARGGLLAALLTAVVRPALATAPAFAMDAPVQGSGKTLLASCVAALATGRMPDVWPHTASRDDEEIRKRLFAALRDGTTALVWDNVTGVFDSAAMAAAITAPMMRDRVLGKSESLGIPNRALLLLTGNNLCPAGDLPRRIITIRIDPGTDTPFARQFDFDPLDHVLEHRLDLARAALVLIRGWLTSGATRADGRMASFEAWDDLVRQTVCWVGNEIAPGQFGDPLELVRRAQGNDPEQESLFALLTALQGVFANAWFTARDVSQRAARGRADLMASETEKMLAEALGDFIKERTSPSPRTIGRILQFREGRIVFGLRLLSRPGRNGREYRVDTVSDKDRCGFGGFGGFNSGDSETGSKTDRTTSTGWADSKQGKSNPPNPPNPQTTASADPEER